MDLSGTITSLEKKINQLINKHKQAVVHVQELSEKNNQLVQQLSEKDAEIKGLTEKNKVIKLAKSIEASGEDTTKLKLKINEVIREVDKCMAMLNK